MLKTLQDAKNYAVDRVQQIAQDDFSEYEKDFIETQIEELFWWEIELLVDDQVMAEIQASTIEELDSKLFFKIPNYIWLLEEVTSSFLAEYLV